MLHGPMPKSFQNAATFASRSRTTNATCATLPILKVDSGMDGLQPESGVEFGLVCARGAREDFVQSHRATEGARFEGTIRQCQVAATLLQGDFGDGARGDAVPKLVVLQCKQPAIRVVELQVVGPHPLAAEQLGGERLQAIRRCQFEDRGIRYTCAVVQVDHVWFTVAVARTLQRAGRTVQVAHAGWLTVAGVVVDPVADGATFEDQLRVERIFPGRFDLVRKISRPAPIETTGPR